MHSMHLTPLCCLRVISCVMLTVDRLAFVGGTSSRDKNNRLKKSRLEAAPTSKASSSDLSLAEVPAIRCDCPDQVPISQELRYFSCSGVRTSMRTPMLSSFNRAISLSISSGTRYTVLSKDAWCRYIY